MEGDAADNSNSTEKEKIFLNFANVGKAKLKEIMCRKFKFHLIYLIAVDNFPLVLVHVKHAHFQLYIYTLYST